MGERVSISQDLIFLETILEKPTAENLRSSRAHLSPAQMRAVGRRDAPGTDSEFPAKLGAWRTPWPKISTSLFEADSSPTETGDPPLKRMSPYRAAGLRQLGRSWEAGGMRSMRADFSSRRVSWISIPIMMARRPGMRDSRPRAGMGLRRS